MRKLKELFKNKKEAQKIPENPEQDFTINLDKLVCTDSEKSEIKQLIFDELEKGSDFENIGMLICFKLGKVVQLNYKHNYIEVITW